MLVDFAMMGKVIFLYLPHVLLVNSNDEKWWMDDTEQSWFLALRNKVVAEWFNLARNAQVQQTTVRVLRISPENCTRNTEYVTQVRYGILV